MYDVDLVREIIGQIIEAIDRIERRSAGLTNPNDFHSSEDGITLYDSICMMLIAIGESCKNLDKISDSELLKRYPEIDWKGIKGMRDMLGHHYFDLNAEIVYTACKKHIPALRTTVETMLQDLE